MKSRVRMTHRGVVLPKSRRRVKFENLLREIKANKVSYFFIAPFAVIFFTFTVVPILIAVGLSFTYFNMLEPPRWVGWQNYLRLFLGDEVFLIAVKNTFIFALITGPTSYFLCLILAWMINELKPRLRAILTLIFYAPSISGASFMVWTYIVGSDAHGLVNSFLLYWGLIDQPIHFLMDAKYVFPVVIIVVLWMSLSINFLVFIAGLQGIDEALYEAGAVDGIRNRFQELLLITLPVMRPQLMFGAIMTITGSFTAATQIVPLSGLPSTDYAAHTIVTHLLDYGNIRFEMGYASTIAVILFIAMVTVQRMVQKALSRLDK